MNTNQDSNEKIKMLNDNKKDLLKSLSKSQQKVASQGLIIDKLKSELDKLNEVLSQNDKSKLDINQLRNRFFKLSKEIEKENSLDSNFKYLNNDFIQALSTKHPLLSLDDLKLCYLLKMKLSSKEIASTLNISLRGVETRRYRLTKKLDLSGSTSVMTFY